METWLSHWRLARDPFDGLRSAFVNTATHHEAVARLVHTIESAGRSAGLIGGAGLGKSRVLSRVLEATRSPARRLARINGPTDGTDLFARLAIELGGRVVAGSSRAQAWRALTEAARLCRWQGLQVVLAIDDAHELRSESDRMDLARLDELDPDPAARLTVVRLSRPHPDASYQMIGPIFAHDWSLGVRLEPLTRAETATYLVAKLESVGRSDATFTPRAVTRLHAASAGVPRGIDRIASLALMASGFRRLEIISPEVVDEAARDCQVYEPSLIDS